MELNPLNQINPIVIGTTVATFTASYFVLRKVFFVPVIDVMEKRQARSVEAEKKYAEADEILRTADEECAQIGATANEEAAAHLAKSRSKVDEVREVRLAEARAEAERMLEEGRASIHQEAELERARLRTEAVECVSLSCDKLFGHSDRLVVESNVDRVIAKTLH